MLVSEIRPQFNTVTVLFLQLVKMQKKQQFTPACCVCNILCFGPATGQVYEQTKTIFTPRPDVGRSAINECVREYSTEFGFFPLIIPLTLLYEYVYIKTNTDLTAITHEQQSTFRPWCTHHTPSTEESQQAYHNKWNVYHCYKLEFTFKHVRT